MYHSRCKKVHESCSKQDGDNFVLCACVYAKIWRPGKQLDELKALQLLAACNTLDIP